MVYTRICPHCKCEFDTVFSFQKYCNPAHAELAYTVRRYRKDEAFRRKRLARQASWRSRNPDYMDNWRMRHPLYEKHRREDMRISE